MRKIVLLIVLASLLFFGCMSITVEQKVNKDGSSHINYTMDMSGLVSYIETMYSSDYYTTTIEPNEEFDITDYDLYSNAEDAGLIIEITPSYGGEITAGSSYEYFDVYVLNTNNHTVKNVKVSYDSYAFVEPSYSSSTATLGTLEAGEDEYGDLTVAVADVEAGEYPLVLIVSYYDNENEKQTIAETVYLDVKGKAYDVENSLEQLENMCEPIEANYSDVECEYKNGILTLVGETTPEEGKYEFTTIYEFPYTVYTLEANNMPGLPGEDEANFGDYGSYYSLESSLDSNTGFDSPAAKTSAAMWKMMGAELTYIIEMPGEIYKAEYGKIEGNKVTFDVIELMEEQQKVVVKSRELEPFSAVALVLAAGLILLILYFVLKNKITPSKTR